MFLYAKIVLGNLFVPDEMVELVYETARACLLQTGRFVLANLYADMALFCVRYLSSAPFS
ncbi:uncharacterized protein P884DRAFT_262885 [Thermothelomyces heterothallicus CBS 202.75]|uniref:uncharacterized protein n=1 Tax=Thermothelomyces heterothallicus CBS 202.75 TaxID=1149848 RepID=UPI00374479A2